MTTETNDSGNKPSEAGNASPPENAPCCAPGCGCGEPAGNGNKKLKIGVCIAVIVAVCGILLYKTTNARQPANCSGNAGFAGTAQATSSSAAVNSLAQQAESGTSIPSLSTLNTMAAKLNSVFLIVPGKDNAPPTPETVSALETVGKTLLAKGIRTGVFTLQTTSPDYPDMASQVSAPNIAVLTKGKGIGVVSGPISESNLSQAYVASTRGGGCCPPGAGPAAVPCK